MDESMNQSIHCFAGNLSVDVRGGDRIFHRRFSGTFTGSKMGLGLRYLRGHRDHPMVCMMMMMMMMMMIMILRYLHSHGNYFMVCMLMTMMMEMMTVIKMKIMTLTHHSPSNPPLFSRSTFVVQSCLFVPKILRWRRENFSSGGRSFGAGNLSLVSGGGGTGSGCARTPSIYSSASAESENSLKDLSDENAHLKRLVRRRESSIKALEARLKALERVEVVVNGDDDEMTRRRNDFQVTNSQWPRSIKNSDVSTGPLARPFARSFAPLSRSLAPHYSLRSRTPLHSFVSSLVYSHRSLILLLRTTRFARALHCIISFTRSLAPNCSLRSRPPLRSLVRSLAHFAHSLARGRVND